MKTKKLDDTINFKDLMPVYENKPPRSYQFRFTVFTPVFNCEKSIKNVHESLINQTFKDFEWLIINDASTDRTNDVILDILKESPLNINYVNNKINKHKMSCFIQSINLAKGEFLLTFDGDDECYPHALETFNKEYEIISDELKPKVAAVTGLCVDQFGNLIGNLFPEDPFYCNTFEAEITKKIMGEKWGFTKTDVLKNININPNMLEHGYIPEGIIWNTVARSGFLTKCINKKLRIYNIGIKDSITNTPMTAKSAWGTVLFGLYKFRWLFKKYFFKSPVYFMKVLYVTIRSTRYLDYSLRSYLKSIDSLFVKTVFIVLWPVRKYMR